MSTRRIALIGAGAMGANHARTIASSDRTELALVVDLDRDRAVEIAGMYGTAWTSDSAMIADVDAAVVATPAEFHTEIVLDLLSSGIPVLVEKPASPDPVEVRAMVDLARYRSVPLQVGFVERFNPVVQAAMEHLQVHGPAIHVTAVRHSPPNPRIATSVIYDLVIHDLDLVFRLTGAFGAEVGSIAGWAPSAAAGPEIAGVCGTTDTGAVFSVSSSRMEQRKIREIRVTTSTVLLDMDLLRRTMTIYRHIQHAAGLDPAGYQAQTLIDIPFVRQEGEPLALQWRAFLDLIDGHRDLGDELDTIEAPHALAGQLVGAPRPVADHAGI